MDTMEKAYIIPDSVNLRREGFEMTTLGKVDIVRSVLVCVNVDYGIED
jgi:hypothetical protein